MSQQLTRFFTAVSRLRRSEREIVRAVAASELEDLRAESRNVKLTARIDEALNRHQAEKARASTI